METKSLRIFALIAALIGSANTGASVPKAEDVETAQVMAELIQAGRLKIDPKSGKVIINSSVLELLQDAGVVNKLNTKQLQAAPSCESTTGSCL